MSATERQKPAPTLKPAPIAPLVTSQQLLGDARELRIEHGGEHYSLRLTRNGKLILTK
jgi:hemin uptake protein HemP